MLTFFFVQYVHLILIAKWNERSTRGTKYFGRSARDRQHFKRWLRIHSLILTPILRSLSCLSSVRLSQCSFSYKGVAGPRDACSPESFQRAVQYVPTLSDVIVVTQMKCGTTWMLHVVLQVLSRGKVDLVGEQCPLNAVSPWLESDTSVSVEDARLFQGRRIIKTHLPVSLAPYDTNAKFIYVVRNPASCFASCVDFVRSNLAGYTLSLDECEQWFCSNDRMWWGSWPEHVAAWCSRAESAPNILIVRFEDMKRDLASVVNTVAKFLEVEPLTGVERVEIVEKCSFRYMRRNADIFEIHPPHLLQSADCFFACGTVDRYRDLTPAVQERIMAWCRSELSRVGDNHVGMLYPELRSKDTHSSPGNTPLAFSSP